MEKKVKVALTGASGNMGERVFAYLLPEEHIEEVRILNHDPKGTKAILKANKKYLNKVKVFDGTIADKELVAKFIDGVDYVLNLAAAIPPESDKFPLHAIEANETGVKVLTECIANIKEHQPKLIHTSTMGIYGDRNYKHLYGEVGDPLLISPFDLYALTKMRGDLMVIESGIKSWAIIRQSGMLYDKLMDKNMDDGLMFHTCVNSPLEWTTANISAILYRNIIRKDLEGELNEKNFWRNVFNLGAGEECRVTGFETMNEGFRIIGSNCFDFYEPNYSCQRNFHGMWFRDGQKLEEMFRYQGDTPVSFWDHVIETHKAYKIARIFPKKMMKNMIIKPILKDSNAPSYWYAHKDEARMLAYFGGSEKYEALPKDWKDFNVLALGKDSEGKPFDYEHARHNPYNRLNHFFDIDKPKEQVTIEDMRNVAEAHAGKLISKDYSGDLYQKLEWENQDGERFMMSPFAVLYGGHWDNVSYHKHAWDFDRLSKKDKIYAQIWYDQHEKDEDNYYYYDDKFDAQYEKIK